MAGIRLRDERYIKIKGRKPRRHSSPICERWKRYFSTLQHTKSRSIDPSSVTQRPKIMPLGDPPNLDVAEVALGATQSDGTA